MKVLKKIGKVLLIIVLVISMVLVVGLNIKTILASHKNKDVLAAAKTFDDLTVRDDVEIFGLGEATHGNKEFQEAKLEVLKVLVEKYGYSAIVLEADFGDCLEANAYIQGAEGDAREIANNMDFTLYHTQEMADLFDWMREYNASVSEDKHIRVYGFDMQYPKKGINFLFDYMAKNGIEGIDVSGLKYIISDEREYPLPEEKSTQVKSELDEIKKAIEAVKGNSDDFDTVCALKVIDNTLVNMDYTQANYVDQYEFRDKEMAKNVSWILDLEKEIGSGKIMLAAHDGHIGKSSQNVMLKTTMGKELKEKYGDAYYSFGTDFFKSKFNSRVGFSDKIERKNYYVTSADPMAYQAKYTEDGRYFLDFETLSPEENKAVYDLVHSDVTMGSVGEGFSGVYYLFHSAYRIEQPPVDYYDGMMFYYEVSPIAPEE